MATFPRPTSRFRLLAGFALTALTTAVVGGGLVLWAVEDYSLPGAIYQAIITLSTLGDSELHAPTTAIGKIAHVGIVIIGIAGLFGGALALITESVQMVASQRWRTAVRADDHEIVCGYGRIGRIVAAELRDAGNRVVVVDNDEQRVQEARDDGFDAVLGDAGDDGTLERAGIRDAAALISTFDDDSDNVFVVLAARNLSTDVRTFATSSSAEAAEKLELAGADRVVQTEVTAGRALARAALTPLAVDLLLGSIQAGEFGQLTIDDGSPHTGSSIREFEARARVRVVAYLHDGEPEPTPDPDTQLQEGWTLLIHGRSEDIAALTEG